MPLLLISFDILDRNTRRLSLEPLGADSAHFNYLVGNLDAPDRHAAPDKQRTVSKDDQ
jgi:hypothetical protein